MRTLLLQSGLNKLNEQSERSEKIRIAGFQAGTRRALQEEMTSWDYQEPDLKDMQGGVALVADSTYVSYTPASPDSVKLYMWIPESVAEMVIGNVVLLVEFVDQPPTPFCFSATDRATRKWQTEVDSPGLGYWLGLTLVLPDLLERMDFGDLEMRVPEWLSVGSEQSLPLPYADGHDQFIVNSHSQLGNAQVVINAQNRHMGCPLLQPINLRKPQTRWTISGGVSGDGYREA